MCDRLTAFMHWRLACWPDFTVIHVVAGSGSALAVILLL
jgi:hypothetical protein